jgi:hypothetical protein
MKHILLLQFIALATMQSTLTMEPVEESRTVRLTIEKTNAVSLAIDHALCVTIEKKSISNDARLEQLKELLAAKPSQKALNAALDRAFTINNEAAAELFINHGADHDLRKMKYSYYFPLWNVAARGWVNLCKLLLEKNAAVNAQMYPLKSLAVRPMTALGVAALHGRAYVVELLLAHKANTNIIENKGRGVLHLAVFGLQQAYRNIPNPRDHAKYMQDRDYETTCKLLIEHGADKNLKDDAGKTAHDYYQMFEFLKPNINN